MPDLYNSLLKQDIGQLRIIAELWGLELPFKNEEAAREKLSVALLEPNLLAELIDSLSPEARSAITTLINSGGRIPWPTFIRRFGEIREAGAGKRDREKPYRSPISAAETLYYRGLLARAFFDTEKGPQEFAYIPDDLLNLLGHRDTEAQREDDKGSLSLRDSAANEEALGRPASPRERGQESPADDFILDDATTLLAALRMGKTLESASSAVAPWRHLLATRQEQAPALQSLLTSAKLIENNVPRAEAVKAFLESPRKVALKMLTDAWMESESFNELQLMPGILCEGEWKNQPQETREFLVNLLDAIPEGKWWSLSAFIREVKQKYADFQRPAGDYDSWFIKRASDGQYLRGFASWEEVDGALIKYFITDILHWLGQVDLCVADGGTEPTSFRLLNTESRNFHPENQRIHVSSQGLISVPRLAPRVVRYQVSRFCEWEAARVAAGKASERIETEPRDDMYRYRLSTNSLAKAKEQGLKVEHLLLLLTKHSEAGIPPTLVKALKRWEANGTEARVQTQTILKVSKPEVLEEMRRSKAARFLGEALSPTTVIVRSGAIQKVMDALTELGLLTEIVAD